MSELGTLILLRHGQSTLNAQGRFTGLLDPPLTSQGRRESRRAAESLADAAFIPECIFSSAMSRALETAQLVNEILTAGTVPIQEVWELNERSYGALTGLCKSELLAHDGPQVLHSWRRSLYGAPPPMTPRQLAAIGSNRAVTAMPQGTTRPTESLHAVVTRLQSFWHETVQPLLHVGTDVLIVGHGNSLRALCLIIDSLSEAEVEDLNLPTAHPLAYRFRPGFIPFPRAGTYLDPGAAAQAVAALTANGGT